MKYIILSLTFFISSLSYSSDDLRHKQIIDTLERMERYSKDVDINENRERYHTYSKPVKVHNIEEFEYIKEILQRYKATSSLVDSKIVLCNQVGIMYAYYDFLKMNKQFATRETEILIKMTEDHIRSYSSLYKTETGKLCSES